MRMCRCKRVTNEKSISFTFAVLQAIRSLQFSTEQYSKGPVSFNTLHQTNISFIFLRLNILRLFLLADDACRYLMLNERF